MKKLISVLILTLIVQLAFGQYTETITSSRPGQAFTPLSVGKNVLQVQSGFTFNRVRLDNFDDELNGINYSALFRYGLSERIEFRTTLGLSRISIEPQDVSTSGFSTFALGTKINLINGQVNKPKLAFQADFSLPAVKDDFESEKVATTLILAYSQGLTNAISVNANFGLNWDGNAPHDALGLYTLNFGFSLTEKLSTFIEAYGVLVEEDENEIHFDGGFGYLLNSNLMVDLSGGYGKNQGVKQFFADFGLSWRTRFGS